MEIPYQLYEAIDRIRDDFCNAAQLLAEPSAIYRPKLTIDGNMWCALYGDNLQDGVAGFGETPEKAMQDFNKNWAEFTIKTQNRNIKIT